MTLAQLIDGVPGVRLEGDGDRAVCQVVHDSRRIVPGGVYVALPGRYYDGTRYIADAVARGAVAVALADESPVDGAAALRLADPRPAMAEMAARICGRPSERLALVGVTGTNGKTTTTTLIADMVRAAGQPDGLIGTNGVRVGGAWRTARLTTPESPDLQALLADMVDAGVGVAAMEVSSVGLAEDRCEAVRFAAAGYLNLTADHLDYHQTMDAYGAAKRRLFTRLLDPAGVAVINVEDDFGRGLAEVSLGEVWRLSLEDPAAEVHVRDLALDATGCAGTLVTPVAEVPLRCPLVGRYNAVDAALAGALAMAVGVPAPAVAAGLESAAIPGRMQTIPNDRDLTVVVDYAHSDDALLRVIAALRPLTVGRLWCVFGCGGDRDATKRGPMGAAAARADGVVITNDNPRSEDPATIAAAALAGAVHAGRPEGDGPAPGQTWVQLDRRTAIRRTIAAAAAGDTILIAGKGHEPYQEIAGVRHPFDDAAQARAALVEVRR